jgi:hypothetical protein
MKKPLPKMPTAKVNPKQAAKIRSKAAKIVGY